MKKILNPVQVQSSCLKITCANDQGTAFYVSNNLLLTAFHVIMDAEETGSDIFIDTPDGPSKCNIVAFNQEFDLCLLSTEKRNGTFLPLLSIVMKVNEKCETYGYPYKGQLSDLFLTGKINQVLIGDKSDFVISGIDIDKNYDYDGLSGAPVIINGNVAGIVLRQIDDRISAISIGKIKEFLLTNGLDVGEEYNYFEVPDQFIDEVKNSTPNYIVFERINHVIEKPKHWFLIKGSPGSGKSTIVASFLPDKENFVVAGRYFVKVPNDTEPLALRTSTNFFLSTIENLISRTVTGFPIPKEELEIEQRIQRLATLLGELSHYYAEKDQVGLIFIDGLDEVKNLEEFLGIFPLNLPDHIKFLLSCTSREILPSSLKTVIEDEQVISVTPIDLGQCETFIIKNIGQDHFPITIVQEIAFRSEGHPLYLRYLVNFIKSQAFDKEKKELEQWVKSIPAIGGDISKYYDSIWEKIAVVPDKLWITIILSQLRQPILEKELYEMLPNQFKLSFSINFPSIKYLLNEKQQIEIYHNSFKEYIISKTNTNIGLANDYISEYCDNNAESKFSISNSLYHFSLSSHPEKAVVNCNQNWADKCILEDVSPDLVINDIRKIINVSIGLSETTELIRLLLLLQRIEFRYDSVFAENADLIALSLIANGKYESAIKYLVRDNTLLVSNNTAINFLMIFYENDANSEAEILLEAINIRFRRLLEELQKSEGGASLDVFILKSNASTLSMNTDFKKGFLEVMRILRSLKKIQDAALKDSEVNTSEGFYQVREYMATWQMAYILRRFDLFKEAELLAEETGIKLDNKWANMSALSANLFKEFNDYNTVIIKKSDNYLLLIEDIEKLIVKYGYVGDKIELQNLIFALIEDSKNYSLVSELIGKFLPLINDFSLRAPNEVDLNYKEIHSLFFEFKCRGYIDNSDEYPVILNSHPRYKHWEEYVTCIIKAIAFIEGKLFRLRAENKIAEIKIVNIKHVEYLNEINFTFSERTYWDRSYHIPEALFPIIYSQVVKILSGFDTNSLDNFLNEIAKKFNNQLGIYSEGFRKCLFEISTVLLKVDYDVEIISNIVQVWESHTIGNVQNRWERTPELLKIVEIYGIIDKTEYAKQAFIKMLETSMGPSWYKESQLDLLNTTLTLKDNNNSTTKYLKEFSGLLDFASGEMTFQRYVRNEKENFVGSLVIQNKLGTAIEYFKNEIIPSPKELISNAERNSIDAPRLGDGYNLGARNITEQNGILKIIDNLPISTAFLKWALCDIFVVNDDIFRYVTDFATHQAVLLNYFESENTFCLDEMYQDLAEIAFSVELNEDRSEYLRTISNILTETNSLKFKNCLEIKGIPWNFDKSENQETASDGRDHSPNRFDVFNTNYTKHYPNKLTDLITEGIDAFKHERISIWFSNWSTGSNKAKENLKSLFQTDKETLVGLSSDINKYETETWIIVDRLIWFLQNNLSNTQVSEIYKIVSEHFSLLIRPHSDAFEKYAWMEKYNSLQNSNDEICKLLIWLLNHPVALINVRTFKSLLNLCKYEPTPIINHLINEALLENPSVSPIKCSIILKELSSTNPQLIVDLLKADVTLIERIKKINHFSIKKNFWDLSINLNKTGYIELYQALQSSTPDVVVLTGEVDLEEDYLQSIRFEISELNDMKLLNRKSCEVLLQKIKEYCLPLTISDYLKSDKYLKRSFYLDEDDEGRFNQLVKYALNVAINPRVAKKDIEQVYSLLN